MKRRALVLTDERAGHPFRRQLPPPGRRRSGGVPVDDDKDWKLFLLSFWAFFTAIYSFIA